MTFRAHLAGTILHKLMPFWFKPAALTQLGSPMPYSEIERRINRDALGALMAVVVAVLAITLKVLRLW